MIPLVLALCLSIAPDFHVVGYLPDYRGAAFTEAHADGLTHLVLFSVEPYASGVLNLRRLDQLPMQKLQQLKQKTGLKLILGIGGWGRSQHFAAVAASEEKRNIFVGSAIAACEAHQLDGIDLDWEHPATATEQQNYAKLLAELQAEFKPKGWTVSVTVAAWQQLPREAFANVNTVQIMAYDHAGKHSTFEGAVADVKKVLAQGAKPEQIILGVPFYGRHVQRKDAVLTYREISRRFNPKPEEDEREDYYWNSPGTIRKKVEYARREKLAGLMIWEIGQDADDRGQSLLKVMIDAARKP